MLNSEKATTAWPPSEEQIMRIAQCGVTKLKQQHRTSGTVLVYWENDPNLLIFEPVHFARTEYLERAYASSDKSISINVVVGRLD